MMTDKRKARPTKDAALRRNHAAAHKAIPEAQFIKHWIDNQTAGKLGKTLREKIDIVIDSLELIWLESTEAPESPTKRPHTGGEKGEL